MAITYDWYENPQNEKEENPGVHPRPVNNGRISMKDLCRHANNWSGLSYGTVISVLDTIVRLCGEELREGREVHVEGLGYFAPTLETSEPVRRNSKYKHTKVKLKSISFRPDERLKREVYNAKFQHTKHPRPALSLSEIEVDMLLKKHFSEHDLLTRYEFQLLCHMARTTAYRHLNRLLKEGKLQKLGRHNQPVYAPMPGYYGVSREIRK